jgi:hypothetical protein
MAIRSAGRTSTLRPRSPSQDLDDPQLAAPVDLIEHHGGAVTTRSRASAGLDSG